MRKLWVKTLVLAVLASAGIAGCGSRDSSRSAAPAGDRSAAPRAVAAPLFTLPDLAGKSVSLSSFKGRVVLVDFWATWCPPCRESIPAIKKLHTEYAPKGLEVLGISVDENPAAVGPFVKKNEIPYTILLGGESDVSERYSVRGIPAIYLVDQSGNVVRHWVGYDPSFQKEWRETIDQLLVSH